MSLVLFFIVCVFSTTFLIIISYGFKVEFSCWNRNAVGTNKKDKALVGCSSWQSDLRNWYGTRKLNSHLSSWYLLLGLCQSFQLVYSFFRSLFGGLKSIFLFTNCLKNIDYIINFEGANLSRCVWFRVLDFLTPEVHYK